MEQTSIETPQTPILVKIGFMGFRNLVAGRPIETTGFRLTDGVVDEPVVEVILEDIGYDTMLVEVQREKIKLIEEHNLMDPDVIETTLEGMDRFGGSFVKELGRLFRRADQVNRMKCLLAWTDYFIQYSKQGV